MLHISTEARQQIIIHAIQTYPNECCGFLLGTESDESREVTKILKVKNARKGDKRRRFEITAQDYLRAENEAITQNLTLLGVYHSHPDHPSVPSEHDRRVAQPYFSYIIVSVLKGRFASLQSWLLNDDFQFEEEKVQETTAPPPKNLNPFQTQLLSDN